GTPRSLKKGVNKPIDTHPHGRLIKKIQRQLTYSANAPPNAGPRIALTPQILERYPWIRARSCTLSISPAIVFTVAIIEPAPRPCIPRKVMSEPIFQETADAAEPIKNTAMPNSKMFLRPKISESLPYRGMVTV